MARTSLRWLGIGVRTNDALTALLAETFGEGDVVIGRRCPRCQSTSHGMPWARHSGRPVAVSVSRSGPHLLVAARTDGGASLGVDVESIEEVNARVRPEDVLHPDDAAFLTQWPLHEQLTRAWVAKEAILKAEGTGLTTDLTQVRMGDWPIAWFTAPKGYLAASAFQQPETSVLRDTYQI